MSELIEINGGVPLQGDVVASGAKNAALPMLIASLLTAGRCEFSNVPQLQDVTITLQLLEQFGAEIERTGDKVVIQTPRLIAEEASYNLVKALRASFWILAPLLARGGAARVALPGGDAIGTRAVDIHLAALSQMGADVSLQHGVVYATAPHGLKPAAVEFRLPSVGATHQVMIAAALTRGTTTIRGAAREPEIVALAEMLQQMGAQVEGAGTSLVAVTGRESLGDSSVHLIGDRIEAGTYLLAGIATRGAVRVTGIDPALFGDFLGVLSEMGVAVKTDATSIAVSTPRELRPVRAATGPFPEFATDLQPLLVAALTTVSGESTVEEFMYDGRFGHVSELLRLGADITVNERALLIRGVSRLSGAPLEGGDIRGAAALAIAGLAAHGTTQLSGVHHIRRGYERFEAKLRGLGARVGGGADVVDPKLVARS